MAQWIIVGGMLPLSYCAGALTGWAKHIHKVLLEIHAELQQIRRGIR